MAFMPPGCLSQSMYGLPQCQPGIFPQFPAAQPPNYPQWPGTMPGPFPAWKTNPPPNPWPEPFTLPPHLTPAFPFHRPMNPPPDPYTYTMEYYGRKAYEAQIAGETSFSHMYPPMQAVNPVCCPAAMQPQPMCPLHGVQTMPMQMGMGMGMPMQMQMQPAWPAAPEIPTARYCPIHGWTAHSTPPLQPIGPSTMQMQMCSPGFMSLPPPMQMVPPMHPSCQMPGAQPVDVRTYMEYMTPTALAMGRRPVVKESYKEKVLHDGTKLKEGKVDWSFK